MINLSQLKKYQGLKKKAKRVGRGNSSGRGTYSGRGQKGQRARSGGKKGLKLKGLRPIIRPFPKNSGFVSIRLRPEIVNLRRLEKKFDTGETIDPKKLFARGLVRSINSKIKILGQGNLTKKFNVSAHAFSNSAKKAIIKAGGQANLISTR